MSTTSTSERGRALVAGLIDDAAVFPPGNATVSDAVDEHRAHRRAWYAEAIGPLLVRASQVEELLAATRPGDDLRIGLIADEGGLIGLAEARNLLLDREDVATLQQVEIALPADHPPAAAARFLLEQLSFSAQAYVEVPRVTGWETALDVLAEDGAERAKLRTGGATAPAHPTSAEVAAFLRACLDRQLGFKLTAGLHHALRTTTTEGFEQHGVLNVLAAVAAGVGGADAGTLAGLLEERRPQPLVERLADADIPAVRRAFVSFGCCGVTDPLEDLRALGLLEKE